MVTGIGLVLSSWAFCTLSLILLGLPLGFTKIGTLSAAGSRRAMWLGLLLVTVVLLASSLVWPLSSAATLVMILTLTGLMGAIAIAMGLRLRSRRPPRSGGSFHRDRALIIAALLAVALFLAVAALGPVTNYDTGLYHLGSIRYAADFGTIPGLANLFNPFGYANSQFVLGAFLGNGPWNGEGYRLLNGLFVVMLLVDLALRMSRRARLPGDYVLMIGAGLAVLPLIGLSDYLVTSPTSDTAVMLLALISATYLTDAAISKKYFAPDASVAIATAIMTFLMRPTMAIFAVLVILVIVILIVRQGSRPGLAWLRIAAVTAIGACGIALQGLRDYFLSGWLLYPLSIHRFDVPWQTIDPTANREMTLAVARDPVNYAQAAHGWEWVVPWIRRLPQQWETYELLAAAVVVLACVLSARGGRPLRLKMLALLLLPAGVSVALWWLLSPPSFRFAWGPLFAIVAMSCGWLLWRSKPSAALPLLLPILLTASLCLVVGFCVLSRLDVSDRVSRGEFRLGGVGLGYGLAPVPIAPTVEKTLSTGVHLLYPTESDQCWAAYPMCTYFTDSDISYRGEGIADGFLP
jgi:hypothetical protein